MHMRKFLLLILLTAGGIGAGAQTFRITISPALLKPSPDGKSTSGAAPDAKSSDGASLNGQSPDGAALDGRLLLLLSKNDKGEPRTQISDDAGTQLVFGIDVEGWQPGTGQLVDMHAFGYPLERLDQVPAGDYYIQALLHKYETFHLGNGRTVRLPMDRGEGQHWNQAPGNIYSTPVKVHFDPARSGEISLVIDQIIPPIAEMLVVPPEALYKNG